MPRYYRPEDQTFKPLKSIHQYAWFLNRLSDEQWSQFQEFARTAKHESVHPLAFQDIAQHAPHQVLCGVHGEIKAKGDGELLGGGLMDGINFIGKRIRDVISPFKKIWNVASNIRYGFTHETNISDHTRALADMIHESYADESDRADSVGDFKRVGEYTGDFIDVWRNETTHPPHTVVTVRGSKNAQDYLDDDMRIAFTGKAENRIGADLRRVCKQFGNNGDIEVAAHSLGTTLLAEALKNDQYVDENIDKLAFFNPASSPIVKSVVNEEAQDDRSTFYLNMGDVAGWGTMLDEQPKNLVMNKPTMNPIANHSLDQWRTP